MKRTPRRRYDVVIIGTGMAGLTLARHLLMYTDKTVLLIDRRENPPRDGHQKYGESLVQCSAYYLSRVLDLQEHLLINHYLKYNLRFHWTTEGLSNAGFEDYSMSYIRKISNIASFQLDRNVLEEHLFDTNTENKRCDFIGGVKPNVELATGADDHHVSWRGGETRCRWVVDASGRAQVIKKKLGLQKANPIRHGAIFFWVDGLVDVERLTGRSHEERIYDRARQKTGQFPFLLATNHFCAEGQWFWVITLHGKTSLGLVYEHGAVDADEVSTVEKTIDYVCRTWPLFKRDLPHRTILDRGRLVDFSYDSAQTISADRWALLGEAGRFSDPLYSPGSDLIAIYNTLVVDAIQTDDAGMLAEKCQLFEQIQRVMYEAYVPTYHLSYDALGDQETFNLKYSWELAVYFGFILLPLLNNLYQNPEFMRAFLQRFAILGPINANIQRVLTAFFQWKKRRPVPSRTEPEYFEFFRIKPLMESEELFYQVGLTPAEAIDVIDRHIERLREFARYILAHVHASVSGDPEALTSAAFIASLKLRHTPTDPQAMRAAVAANKREGPAHQWKLDPMALADYIVPTPPTPSSVTSPTSPTTEPQPTRKKPAYERTTAKRR